MKITALFTLFIVLTSLNVRKTKEIYYFCMSRSADTSVQGKESVLITPVKSVVAEEQSAKTLSKAWETLVNKQCNNPGGCTSDFYYYLEEAAARMQFDNAKVRYSDTSRYVFKMIEFKAK